MAALEKYLQCGLDQGLIHLLKMRASQINGCAYCIDMHFQNYIYLAKPSSASTSSTPGAKLPFTLIVSVPPSHGPKPSLSHLPQTHVPDSVYEDVRIYFSEKEIVDLTSVASTINAWNRLAIAMRAVPGHYHPAISAASAR